MDALGVEQIVFNGSQNSNNFVLLRNTNQDVKILSKFKCQAVKEVRVYRNIKNMPCYDDR